MAGAFAAILLIGLSAGTLLLWTEIEDMKRKDSQISTALQVQLEWTQKESDRLQNLLDLAYTNAIPGMSTVMLEGTGASSQARGMLMISPKATWAILAALDLQPLPEDKAYQLWLITDGTKESGGMFTVDETGYGQLKVQGVGSIMDFKTMGVSIEPAQGSPGPTGANVLTGFITSPVSP